MIKYSLVVGSLLVLLSPGVSAQIPGNENKWEVSAFVGVGGSGDDTFVTPVEGGTSQDVGLGFEESYALGVRVTENLGRYFGVELEYSFINQPLLLQNLSPAVPRLALAHKVHKLAYSILVYVGERGQRIRPFGSIGVGTSFFQVTNDSQDEALRQGVDLKNRWKLAFSYGAGVKFQMGPGWGFRADFRDQITGVPDFGLPSQAPMLESQETGPALRSNGILHNWQITGGFMYTFR
ncbi:porin family protein [Acidobacteria bacterium AH-259-D05]|nr:porin family protein [Acidobacteria bacterium AH-259-D05]